MKKKYKLICLIIIILILIIGGVIVYKKFFKTEDESAVKVVDSIDDFGYTLDERDSELMKSVYNELKEILNASEIDYDAYAEALAKLFVIDLFTMDNKINKYDVGSTEYVYTDSVDNFKTNVEDTIYKTMENNSDGKREQDLPIVSSITDVSFDTGEFSIGEEEYESYVVNITWEYETDLGYDDEAIITLIRQDNKLYVVEYSAGDTNE